MGGVRPRRVPDPDRRLKTAERTSRTGGGSGAVVAPHPDTKGFLAVHQRSFTLPLAALLAALLTGACSFTTLGVKKGGLERVDELLSHVERVQVESAVSKERAQSAVESLRTLVAPEFKGDPIVGHAALEKAVEESTDQADALQASVRPLRKTGDKVFERWTADLESFGNLAMRQRSQERLEETRRRYDAILAAAISAQLAYDAFNGDLSDHALFLEHDFNTTSVALIAQELDGLKSRGRELAKRLDTVAAACQAYVEFSAPGAQIEPAPAAPEVAPAPEPVQPQPTPAPVKPAPKKKPAPKPAPTSPQGG